MIKEQLTIKIFFHKNKINYINSEDKKWKKLIHKISSYNLCKKCFGYISSPEEWSCMDKLALVYKSVRGDKFVPLFYVQYIPNIMAYIKTCNANLKPMTYNQINNYYDRIYKKEKGYENIATKHRNK